MSIITSQAVWKHSRAKGSERLTMLCIADHTNREGLAWPSIETIAAETLVSPRQVSRSIGALVTAGELEIITKGNGRGRATTYRILLPTEPLKDDTVSPFMEPLKDDISSIKGDISSLKDDTMSSQPLVTIKEPMKKPDAITGIVESWCNLIGRWPKNDREGQREYGEPAQQILEKASWDYSRAWGAIEEARQNMLKTGRTPYRMSAIKSLTFAILDGYKEPPAGSNGKHPGGDPAESAWQKIHDGSRFVLPKDALTKQAIEATGGWARYKAVSEKDLPFLKKEFINAYQRSG